MPLPKEVNINEENVDIKEEKVGSDSSKRNAPAKAKAKKEKRENIFEKFIKIPKMEETLTENGEVKFVPSVEIENSAIPHKDILKWIGRGDKTKNRR